jgi:hypothetical protein
LLKIGGRSAFAARRYCQSFRFPPHRENVVLPAEN